MAHSRWTTRQTLILLLVILVVLIVLVEPAAAFGAGNIPSFSHLEERAFRHGDIEDTLADLIKKGGMGMLGGLGGKKFGGLDIKRVYFGNWLRDYSQAMDIAGLQKISKQTILNLVMALGFLAHGYATSEFEVTEERLGVYLPVEHIDNPKGYGEGEDPRKVDPPSAPPVDPRELEVDPRTAMKNYIANENGNWDTSTACICRNLTKCIEWGRRARQSGNDADLFEAYRLLGTALHTLEDLPAHSNWCELSLKRLGYHQVFCHVGEAVNVQTPSGPAPCLVTGTFGSADFMHSLLGEASDHISEASVSDLNKAMTTARGGGSDPMGDTLRDMLFELPGPSGESLSRQMDGVQGIRSRAAPGSGFDPSQMSPQELHSTLWQILKFRDDVCKTIENTIEKIPGLSALVEKLTNAVNKFVFTTLEPYLKPIMQSATGQLQSGSAAIIDKQDQYEVFNNAHASDPTHSLLSKDHFALILNEPAGNIAKIIIKHTVKGIVEAWDNNSKNDQQVINKVLEAFHHPYFVDGTSEVQREMGQYMKDWIGNMPHADKDYILAALTKDSVRNGKNKRKGTVEDGQQGCGHATIMGQQYQSFLPTPQQLGGKILSHAPGFNTTQQLMGGGGGGRRDFAGNSGYPGTAYGGRGPPESFSEGFSMPTPTATASSPTYNTGLNFPSVDLSTPAGYSTPFPGSEAPLRNDNFGGGYHPDYNNQQSGAYPSPPASGPGYGAGGYTAQYSPPPPPQGQYGGPPQGQYGGPPPGQYGGPTGQQGGPPPWGQPPAPQWGQGEQRPPPPWGAQGGGYQSGGGGGYPSGGYQ